MKPFIFKGALAEKIEERMKALKWIKKFEKPFTITTSQIYTCIQKESSLWKLRKVSKDKLYAHTLSELIPLFKYSRLKITDNSFEICSKVGSNKDFWEQGILKLL